MMQYDGVIMMSYSGDREFNIKSVHKIIGEVTIKDKVYMLVSREIIDSDEEDAKHESV